jgi:hypothetical protein
MTSRLYAKGTTLLNFHEFVTKHRKVVTWNSQDARRGANNRAGIQSYK